MTQSTVINSDETISDSETSYVIQSHAHKISFIGTSDDIICNKSANDTIDLQLSIQTTIKDQTHGMHLDIDPWSLLTTVTNFQNDPSAVIDFAPGTFSSQAALKSCLKVVPGFGTELVAELHGPIVMFFPGDYHVRTSQLHLMAATS